MIDITMQYVYDSTIALGFVYKNASDVFSNYKY